MTLLVNHNQLAKVLVICRWLGLSKEWRCGAAYEFHCTREIFAFLFRLSLDYKEAGSEPYDGFLAVKRDKPKYLEAWLRQYILSCSK